MRSVELEIPESASSFLRDAIRGAAGQEVYFLGRVDWSERGAGDDVVQVARLTEVEVFCRGNRASAPAIIQGAETWDLSLHNHPSGRLEPSEADIAVAGELGNRGVGFAIIDNEASQHYLVVRPFHRQEPVAVDPAEVAEILGPEGPLARALDGFESRPGQIDMAREVAASFHEGRVVACEAGTGIGKSFAYLVPAILWAVRNREKVIVSTGTINLQEQLVAKDLPFLSKVLPVEFEFCLIKGRGNYACKRKIDELSRDVDLIQDAENDMLRDLGEWSHGSQGGSLSDLSWSPPGNVWEQVMSETDKSLKAQCPFYDECFYYQAKRRASRAHIVVANHHLFFADLSVRQAMGNYDQDAVLPSYRRVIFDEAHHLEDIASEHLGSRITRRGVQMRLGRMLSKDEQKGALPGLLRKLRQKGDPVAAEALERGYAIGLRELVQRIEDGFDEVEQLISSSAAEGRLASASITSVEQLAGAKIRQRELAEMEPFWNSVRGYLGDLRRHLEGIQRLTEQALETLGRSRISPDTVKSLGLDLESFTNRLSEFTGAVESFCEEDDRMVRWIDTQRPARGEAEFTVGFSVAPISVARDLRQALFEPVRSVVLASATLSVADRPNFLADRLGFGELPAERFRFRQHPSPFRFREQVRVVVPTDLPAPGTADFERVLPLVLSDLLDASGGRAFVLFTSYSLLRSVYQRLERDLVGRGYSPFAQGQGQRSEILQQFMRSESGVLFGTDSFWEGVDVKGRALEHVILTRLPFRVPTEPLQEARLEELTAQGKNAFASFTVPQAVLRFKQGFGRLIRSGSDRGIVTILDRRILTKPYGKTFLASLPDVEVDAANARAVLGRIREFFAVDSQPDERADESDAVPSDLPF